MNRTINEKLEALRSHLEEKKVEYRGRTFPGYNKPVRGSGNLRPTAPSLGVRALKPQRVENFTPNRPSGSSADLR